MAAIAIDYGAEVCSIKKQFDSNVLCAVPEAVMNMDERIDDE